MCVGEGVGNIYDGIDAVYKLGHLYVCAVEVKCGCDRKPHCYVFCVDSPSHCHRCCCRYCLLVCFF